MPGNDKPGCFVQHVTLAQCAQAYAGRWLRQCANRFPFHFSLQHISDKLIGQLNLYSGQTHTHRTIIFQRVFPHTSNKFAYCGQVIPHSLVRFGARKMHDHKESGKSAMGTFLRRGVCACACFRLIFGPERKCTQSAGVRVCESRPNSPVSI